MDGVLFVSSLELGGYWPTPLAQALTPDAATRCLVLRTQRFASGARGGEFRNRTFEFVHTQLGSTIAQLGNLPDGVVHLDPGNEFLVTRYQAEAVETAHVPGELIMRPPHLSHENRPATGAGDSVVQRRLHYRERRLRARAMPFARSTR